MGINGKSETASVMTVQRTRKASLVSKLRLLGMFIMTLVFSQLANAAEITLGDVYKGIGNTYGIETQSISISSATKVVGTNFAFTSLDPTSATFTGNNVPGFLSYKDANGVTVQIRGVVSRPEKVGNTDRAVYFYTSDANDAPLGEAYLLVFTGYESVFPGTGNISTSSDPVDQSLNSQIKLIPTITLSVSSLSGFTACAGQSSTPQTFTVSGTNLTADIVLTAPTGYQLSLSSASGYGSSVTIALPTGSTSIAVTTVYVRLASTATNGATGNITATSTGATDKTIAIAAATVNPLPTATAGSNSPVCNSTALNLTSSGGSTYAWSGPNGFTSTLQNPTIANATSAAAGTYTVTVTSAAGCSATASTSVVVNSGVTASASAASTSLCVGGTISLSASGGSSYAWSGPNGFNSSLQNPSISNATVAASGTYTVTVSSGAGCSGTASVSVTVNAGVSATAGAVNTSICAGGTISLSASSGSTYAWSGPNGFTSSSQNPTITNASVAASGTYTVLVSSGAGCSGSASVNVTVNALPTVSGTLSACSGGATSQLTGTGTPAASNAWVSSNSSIVTVSATGLVTTVGSGTAQITYTNSGGCSASVTFTSSQTPAAPSGITGETAVVPTKTYSYSVSQVAGATSYNWLYPAGWTGSSTSNVISLIAGTTEGKISVTASANGCTSAPATINVSVSTFIADVITPNGDGFNDKWFVIVPSSKRASVLIFNRWGQQVYKNDDYKSDWNGTGSVNFPNNILPNGTYLYVVELIDRSSSAKEIKKGTLTLRR